MTALTYLKHGRLNAITGRKLAVLISGKPTDYKDVQREIGILRMIGYPIVACNDGYYLATDFSQVKAFTDNCKKRAKKTLKMCAMMKRMISKFNGQKKLLLKTK